MIGLDWIFSVGAVDWSPINPRIPPPHWRFTASHRSFVVCGNQFESFQGATSRKEELQ